MIQYRDALDDAIPRKLIQHALVTKDKIHYHFANNKDAKNYLQSLQKKFWNKNLFATTKIKRTRCKHSSQYQRCQEVTLLALQHEKIYGQSSHQDLYDICHSPTGKSSTISSILKNMSNEFSEELALIIPILDEKKCNYLAGLQIGEQLLLMHPSFCDSLLPRLNLDSIEKLKLEHDQTKVLLGKLFKNTQLSHDSLQIFLNKLGDRACKDFIYCQNRAIFEYRDDICRLLLSYLNDQELNHFVANLLDKNEISTYEIGYLLVNAQRLHPAIIAQLNYLRSSEEYLTSNETKDSDKLICKMTNALFDYSDALKPLLKKNSLLSLMEICDGGVSTDSWTLHATEIISLAPPIVNPKISLDLNRFEEGEMKDFETRHISEIIGDKFRFHHWHAMDSNALQLELLDLKGNRLYLRVQEKDEPLSSLIHQFKTAKYFKTHAGKFELKSFFPQPVGVFQVTGLLNWLKKNSSIMDFREISEMIAASRKHGVYVSEVAYQHYEFNTFLYDASLSDNDFKNANQMIVHDLFTMLKQGLLLPNITLLLHHSHKLKEERADYGRFLVLASLLLGNKATGTGRLDRWESSISGYQTKLRASGIMHLHEAISINDLIVDSAYLNQYHRDATRVYDQQAANFILANIMAEYQYILFLMAGMRGLALIQEKINPPDLWLNLAKQVVQNCALASSLLTHQPVMELENKFAVLIDVERLGRQMKYWMTGEYIEDIMENKIQADIYNSDTKVYVNFESFCLNSYNSILGFTYDSIHSDLGNINGQEPIKEASKLFYLMVTHIFAFYSQVKLTLEDVRKISSVKDLKESEKLRKESFSHLYGQSYHAIQKNLCRERLLQTEPIPQVMKVDIHNEEKYHTRQEAAFKIGHFWRRCKKEKPDTLEMKKNIK